MINRTTLARLVRKSAGISYSCAVTCVDCVLDALGEGIARGERIELRGLGSFTVRPVPGKTYPSMQWSENTAVPSHGRIIFRPSNALRRAAWNLTREAQP